jgi:hypothetical protein
MNPPLSYIPLLFPTSAQLESAIAAIGNAGDLESLVSRLRGDFILGQYDLSDVGLQAPFSVRPMNPGI